MHLFEERKVLQTVNINNIALSAQLRNGNVQMYKVIDHLVRPSLSISAEMLFSWSINGLFEVMSHSSNCQHVKVLAACSEEWTLDSDVGVRPAFRPSGIPEELSAAVSAPTTDCTSSLTEESNGNI